MDTEKKVKIFYILGGVVMALALFLAVLLAGRLARHGDTESGQNFNSDNPDDGLVSVPVCLYAHHLSGECYMDDPGDSRPVAVMVELSSDAWPLVGIERARVVYEAPVEGNIPRLMALYDHEDNVSEVGPVRSARPYYVDYMGQYEGGLYAHVGGSPAALERLQSDNLPFLGVNEFFRGAYFWRAADRSAPHNVFFSSERWKKLPINDNMASRKIKSPIFVFADEPCPGCEKADSVLVAANTTQYRVCWSYDEENKKYRRVQGGGRVAFEEPILSANVVFVETSIRSIDNVGRKDVRTIGTGSARLFTNGTWQSGTWSKESVEAPLIFKSQSGEILKFGRGQTWIQILPSLGALTVGAEGVDLCAG